MDSITIVAFDGERSPQSPSPYLRRRNGVSGAMSRAVRTHSSGLVDTSTYRAATTAAVGCSLLLASLVLSMMSGAAWRPTDVSLDITDTDAARRHEIHIKPVVHTTTSKNFDESAFLSSEQAQEKVAVLYTVFGPWNAEVEWEFSRLVAHVTRSKPLNSHDIVLLWETSERPAVEESLPSSVTAAVASHPDRVLVHRVAASEAAAIFPPSSFQHGFYYNPEVAAIMFASRFTQYKYLWLMEADVRWTVRP